MRDVWAGGLGFESRCPQKINGEVRMSLLCYMHAANTLETVAIKSIWLFCVPIQHNGRNPKNLKISLDKRWHEPDFSKLGPSPSFQNWVWSSSSQLNTLNMPTSLHWAQAFYLIKTKSSNLTFLKFRYVEPWSFRLFSEFQTMGLRL